MSTEVLESTDRLVLKRTYKTTLDAIWSAWTEAEKVQQWFGCSQTKNVEATLDLREGGNFKILINSENDEGICSANELNGTYTEVTPKTRLAYTWEWQTSPAPELGETNVLLEFTEVDGGIELTLTHEGFPTAELTALHNGGWSASLDKLESILNS